MSEVGFGNLPLEWVRAFEAAGRTGSFTAAARDTGLTQAAISQRIGYLEKRLGTRLFIRKPRGTVLTVEGETWLPHVAAALNTIRESSEALFGVEQQQLIISCSTTMIEHWILPRLQNSLDGQHLQISFKTLILSSDDTRQHDGIKVRYGTGDWPSAYKVPLFTEEIGPVLSPLLTKADRPWRSLPRIAVTGPRAGWQEWCEQTGEPTTPVPSLRFDTLSSGLAAARAGLGVLCASLPLCRTEIERGSLVSADTKSLVPQATYWLMADRTDISKMQWDWLSELLVDS